mgnify:CR=1 FL=1
MSKHTTRRRALQFGSTVLLLKAPQLAWGAEIVAVRVWPAADYTRVTIESDSPLTQKHFIAENPSRLVIDIDGLELSPALRDIAEASGQAWETLASNLQREGRLHLETY